MFRLISIFHPKGFLEKFKNRIQNGLNLLLSFTMRKTVLPFSNTFILSKLVEFFVYFGSPKRPNHNFLAKKYSVNFLKVILERIQKRFITYKNERNIPFIVVVFFFHSYHCAKPSMVVIVIFYLFVKFNYNFRYVPWMNSCLTA